MIHNLNSILYNFTPILVNPRFPENIGAVARICANMGLGPIRLVNPERLWSEPMQRMATHAGLPWLENMTTYSSLSFALANCTIAAGTSARIGKERGFLISPRQAAPQLLEFARQGTVGLVFGPEDRGLNTQDLDLCSITINIPTANANSLNLAHAVMVLAYELRVHVADKLALVNYSKIEPAPLKEQLDLREHLQKAFAAIKVINPENPEHFMRPYKASLERAQLTSREVRAWRGLARKILWMKSQLDK